MAASVITLGLLQSPSGVIRLGLASGVPPPAAIGPIITLGLKYTPSDIIRLGLGATVGGAAVLSTPTASATGGTTALVGCTTTIASGTLFALARVGGSPAVNTAIEAGGQSVAVSSTTPSFSYTGLSPATPYFIDYVQKVGGVYSNVVSTAEFDTDNTGGGGGEIPAVLAYSSPLSSRLSMGGTLQG